MRYLKFALLTLLVAFLCLFPTPHGFICYGDAPSSKLVDDVYSSVVLITDTEIRTSIWDVLGFTAMLAGSPVGTLPAHIEKKGGTGFQTEWGVVTNSHVVEQFMSYKPDAVLTTFHNKSYPISKIKKIKCENQRSSQWTKIVYPTSKEPPILYGKDRLSSRPTIKKFEEATVYDWGDLGIDLALIRVKIPEAVKLPLAKEVKIGEKVFTLGHPEWRKFRPAVGSIRNIYNQNGRKHIELQIKIAPGCSGSPVLNTKGEVVGVIWGGLKEQNEAEAVHVDEIRKAFGLPVYDSPQKDYSTAKSSQPTPSTERGVLAKDVIIEYMRQDFGLEPDDRIVNITSPPFTADINTVDEFWQAWERVDKTKTCRFMIKRGAYFYEVKFMPAPFTIIQKAPQVKKPWNGAVCSTKSSRLFHRPGCNELVSGEDLVEFSSKEHAKQAGGIACPVCNP